MSRNISCKNTFYLIEFFLWKKFKLIKSNFVRGLLVTSVWTVMYIFFVLIWYEQQIRDTGKNKELSQSLTPLCQS